MKIKKVLLGLVFVLGVVAVFTVMPKQVNAASDEQTVAVIGESNVNIEKYIENNPFINFFNEIPRKKNGLRYYYNKWSHRKN